MTTESRRILADAFARSIREGRLGHAYLLRGPEGAGKRDFALSLVASVECARQDGVACSDCEACRLIQAGRHPDVFVVTPDEGKVQIGIDKVRELIEQMSRRPWNGRGRSAILDPADRLGVEAANCLLRPLEEPPHGALFLLVTSRPEALLPTIRSRATEVFFGPWPAESIRERLVAEAGLEGSRASAVAELAEGNWRRALDLAAEGAVRDRFLDLALGEPGAASTPQRVLEALRQAPGDEGSLRIRLDALLAELLTLARLALGRLWTGEARTVAPVDEPRLEALARLGARRLASLVDRTLALRERVLHSAQTALALERWALEVAELVEGTPIR